MVQHLLLPAVNVYLPKDRVTNNHQGYGFVEFRTEEDADYVRRPPAEQLTHPPADVRHPESS